MLLDTKKPVTYGIKSLKQMKQSNRSTNTLRQIQTVEKTMKYFNEKLDHIISRCITYMLCVQPDDVNNAMLEYFIKFKNHEELDPYKNINRNKPRKDQRLLLATTIGPLVSSIIHQISKVQPDDPIEYIINLLEISTNNKSKQIKSNDSTIDSDSSNKSLIHTDLDTIPKNDNKKIQIAVIGLGSAGKTTIINSIQGTFDAIIKPTIGFRPTSLQMKDDTIVKFYDLGGGKNIRDIWSKYYYDVHAIIYVIDSSTILNNIDEVRTTLIQVLEHSYIIGKPCLILANKHDINSSMNQEEIEKLLNISIDPNNMKISCCIGIGLPKSSNEPESNEMILDERIEKSLEWLLNNILDNYNQLNSRLLNDVRNIELNDIKKRFEKEKKILKNKIIYAFPHLIDKNKVSIDIDIPDIPNDVCTIDEGLKYFADEIELKDINELPDIAKEICNLVGYQTKALSIIGSWVKPIKKKTIPLSYENIHAIVTELRNELGLY